MHDNFTSQALTGTIFQVLVNDSVDWNALRRNGRRFRAIIGKGVYFNGGKRFRFDLDSFMYNSPNGVSDSDWLKWIGKRTQSIKLFDMFFFSTRTSLSTPCVYVIRH